MAFDWSRSGRIEGLRYETIPVTVKPDKIKNPPNKKALNGVTSLKLNWDYYSTEKVSGSIALQNVNPEDLRNKLVRIWAKGSYLTAGGATVSTSVLLATLFAGKAKGRYEDGKWSGSVELDSPLCRFTEDELVSVRTVKKGTKAYALFNSIIKDYGGWGVWNYANNFALPNAVIDYGQPVMDYLLLVEGSSKNEVTVDAYGRTVVSKYVAPSSRSVSHVLPSGQSSIILPGIDTETDSTEVPNRVAVRFDWTDTTKKGKTKEHHVSSSASVSADRSWSKHACGRYKSRAVRLTDVSEKNRTKAYMGKKAQAQLRIEARAWRYYTFKSSFFPHRIGQIVKSSTAPLSGKKLLVAAIDLEADEDGIINMETTVRSV